MSNRPIWKLICYLQDVKRPIIRLKDHVIISEHQDITISALCHFVKEHRHALVPMTSRSYDNCVVASSKERYCFLIIIIDAKHKL